MRSTLKESYNVTKSGNVSTFSVRSTLKEYTLLVVRSTTKRKGARGYTYACMQAGASARPLARAKPQLNPPVLLRFLTDLSLSHVLTHDRRRAPTVTNRAKRGRWRGPTEVITREGGSPSLSEENQPLRGKVYAVKFTTCNPVEDRAACGLFCEAK